MAKFLISDKAYRIVKIILVVLGLFVAYLFALNDRYFVQNLDFGEFVFDKWKNEVYPIDAIWFNKKE